jgi:hypothetical protein
MRTYNMSPAELRTLDKYINNALAKNWIHEFQSPTNTSILFVSKKNRELYLYVNYCGLNAITVKNHYLLPLASKLLDYLDDSTIFSKINL